MTRLNNNKTNLSHCACRLFIYLFILQLSAMTFLLEHNINAWKSIEFTSTAVNLVYLPGKPNISREEATEGSLGMEF